MQFCEGHARKSVEIFTQAGIADMISETPEEAGKKITEISKTGMLTTKNYDPVTGIQLTSIKLVEHMLNLTRYKMDIEQLPKDEAGIPLFCPICFLESIDWVRLFSTGVIQDSKLLLKHSPIKLENGRVPAHLKHEPLPPADPAH